MVQLDGLYQAVRQWDRGALDDGKAEVQERPASQLQGQEGDEGVQRASLLGAQKEGTRGGTMEVHKNGPGKEKSVAQCHPVIQCTQFRAEMAHC